MGAPTDFGFLIEYFVRDMGCLIRHSYGLLYTAGHLKVGLHRTTGLARRIHQHRVHVSSYQL
ncbi:hypothetical protein HanRHA438_Chr15g0701061 [Helianthus annuus]|nr:hypothetical protein HanRHA438_Chr15g0701061 [Helianthus annuus]